MRTVVGLLLIVAATLKAIELYLYPASVLANGVFGVAGSRILLPLLIGGEFGLGAAAILGLYWRQLRWILMGLFVCFSCYAFFLAIQGAASCGCFGQVEVNPWWTFLLDLAVVAGLVVEGSKDGGEVDAARLSNSKKRVLHASSALLALAVTAGLTWRVTPHQAVAADMFQSVGSLVILEPETWVGEPFPLTDHIDLDFSEGKWALLLHRHDCPKCLEAVPQYVQLAMTSLDRRIAIVEVPPYSTLAELHPGNCQTGRLSDRKEWFVQTPVEILLENGRVTSVSSELAFLHSSSVSRNELSNTDKHVSTITFGATFSHSGKVSQ